jgi:cytochrome c oxidase subunit 2
MVTYGEEVARKRQCLACHSVDGQRHVGPTWAGLYESTIELADGRRVLADEAYLTRSMMDPAADLHAGFSPVMPSYHGVLAAHEVGALVDYIKSLKHAPIGGSGITLPASTARASATPTYAPQVTPSVLPSALPSIAPPPVEPRPMTSGTVTVVPSIGVPPEQPPQPAPSASIEPRAPTLRSDGGVR